MNSDQLIGLLLLSACHAPPNFDAAPDVPAGSVVTRGRFTVRDFGKSAAAHCELAIDGVPYLPFGRHATTCSLDPLEDPRAAALALDGDHAGFYLLRLTDSGPLLEQLVSGRLFGRGSWTPDGEQYVIMQLAIATRSGERRQLPEFPGDFWDFSPDGRKILSETRESGEQITLHLTDVRTGEDERTPISTVEHPWIREGRNVIAGTREWSHLWQLAHVKWIDERGSFRFILRASPTL